MFNRKLPWPMSLVERDVLHSLWLESQRTGKPITVIVKAAIDAHMRSVMEGPHMRVTEPAASYQAEEPLPAA